MSETPPSTDSPSTLEARVERLERAVEALLRERGAAGDPAATDPAAGGTAAAGAASTGKAAPPESTPPHPPRTSPGPGRRRRTAADWMRLGEDWLGRIGVVLLLFGLAFLYRYAVERGWVTPWLRVAFGGQVGAVLLLLGLRWSAPRPLYSQALLGGSVAVLYLTGWAAHALYGLLPWIVGFSWMATVTVLALALAERRGHQALAVIGAAGGLATPFLLETASATVTGLVAYAALVLAWSGLLQIRRRWPVLLLVNFVGGLAVMGVAALEASGAERWSAQAGVVVAWAVASVFPLVQGWLHLRGVEDWPPPIRRPVLWLLAVSASTCAVLLCIALWEPGRVGSGVAFLVAAGALLATGRLLRPHDPVALPATDAGALLLVVGTILVAGPERFQLFVALEAFAFLLLARREDARSLATLAHVVFAGLALEYLVYLQVALAGQDAGPDGVHAAGVLGALGVAAAAALAPLRGRSEARTYLLASYGFFLAWLAWVLTPLPGGHGWTSAAWGACALGLLAGGVRRRSPSLRLAGLATLAAVAGKLLLVDLAALDRGVRILVFLGFGATFLGLGYLFRGGDAEPDEAAATVPPGAAGEGTDGRPA